MEIPFFSLLASVGIGRKCLDPVAENTCYDNCFFGFCRLECCYLTVEQLIECEWYGAKK